MPDQAGLATAIHTNAANLGNLVGFFAFGALVGPLGHRGLFFVSAALTVATLVIAARYRPRPGVHVDRILPAPVSETLGP